LTLSPQKEEGGVATQARLHGEVVGLLEARRTSELATLIAARGGRPLAAPALREEPVGDDAAIDAFLNSLARGEIEFVIFQTGVGTRALLEATERLGRREEFLAALARRMVAVRGPKPTAVLRQAGVRIDVSAAEPYTTVELLAALDEHDRVGGKSVAIQHYGETNRELRRALEQRGAVVINLDLYRWALPEDEGPVLALLDALTRGEVACIAVTSQAQVTHLFAIADKHGRAAELRCGLAGRVVIAAVGPVCARALEAQGVAVDVVASPPKMGPLVLAIAEALAPVMSS
jgi:uroporphyrinogen-III synthase